MEELSDISTVACAASISARFRSKERGTRVKMAQVKVSFFGARFISRAAKAENSDFLGLSFLRNQTETLATQAISTVNHDPFSYIVRRNQLNALNLKYSDNNPMLNYPVLGGFCLSKYKTDFSTVNYDPFN